MNYFLSPVIILLLGISLCTSLAAQRENTQYDFSSPDTTLILPDTLREISGLTMLDSVSFACIQDENGIVFIYDLPENRIRHQFSFHIDGDYEGICRKGDTLYVLQSDGVLFEILNYTSGNYILQSYVTGIPASNNEGLCYDEKNNRLLIACKGKTGKGPELKDRREIYAFDLETKKLSAEPAYAFNVQEVKKIIIDKNIELPSKIKKTGDTLGPLLKFMTSAIGIHPLTQQLYLISAVDHLLFVVSPDGKIEEVISLDTGIFNKAEGISFFANGDLLITNEAQSKKPSLLLFRLKTD